MAQDSSAGPVRLVPRDSLGPAGPAGAQAEGGQTQPGLPTTIPKARIQGIEINPLEEIAPDSIGTLSPEEGGFGADMWRGTERLVAERLLRRLPRDMHSRTMRELARRLLLSVASPPAESVPPEAPSQSALLALRIERLALLGEVPALNRLLSVVPGRHEDESISRIRVDGLLLARQFDEACRLVRNRIASYHELPYWQKALVFCQMAAGEVDKGMLGLDLLREQGVADDPTFFALANAFMGVEADLPDDTELSPLHFAMLQAAGAPLPSGAVWRASPGLLFALANAPSADLEQRAQAAELVCAKGQLDGAVLAEIYQSFSFAAEELGNALGAVESLEGPRARALLYQAARNETLPATRAEVLRVALQRAERAGLYQALVPVLVPLIAEIEAVPELAWFATTAGRALYAAGRHEEASAWLTLGRQEAIISPQASAAVAVLWPYSRLAGGAALTTDGNLAAWRAMREGMGGRALGRSQSLLRASFQALGERDPLPWSLIAANGEPVSRLLPNAALLYALEEASDARRIGETVLLSLVVLGEGGPAQSHTLALGAVLSALTRVGLEREARALAIEAALANGV
ncbi:MAG: hypothetical protein ACE5GS_15810 [Kiloniellaceae bacterium]